MNFEKALELLKQGKRIIRQEDKEGYDQMWLHYYNGVIHFMNEPWEPDAAWLCSCLMADDWIDVEQDKDYHCFEGRE